MFCRLPNSFNCVTLSSTCFSSTYVTSILQIDFIMVIVLLSELELSMTLKIFLSIAQIQYYVLQIPLNLQNYILMVSNARI